MAELESGGFIRPDVDPRHAAVLVQMRGIGRLVDDAAGAETTEVPVRT